MQGSGEMACEDGGFGTGGHGGYFPSRLPAASKPAVQTDLMSEQISKKDCRHTTVEGQSAPKALRDSVTAIELQYPTPSCLKTGLFMTLLHILL